MKIEISEYDLSTAVWSKSSYSGGDGGNCVEVATWHKSSYSDGSGGDCLEVSCSHPGVVPVRDSKNPDGPKLVFRTAAWSEFIEEVRTAR
ncbi:DUF397 domain-containing protein [Streptomyces roseicoloratus]|uniref:DUF397 domain-containing protein n=1 Tax=Streptomyces roseicoloratus TaxID=2508722 RepID=A0ABY9RVM5_9ACTN|nr:DUF397 domain-containing protein [Streptomyces roseicoloratus]WMX45803.1 DUF397 domain-containing protein [Streptomyces roseicoloratus]